jgi:hypothetical protein
MQKFLTDLTSKNSVDVFKETVNELIFLWLIFYTKGKYPGIQGCFVCFDVSVLSLCL